MMADRLRAGWRGSILCVLLVGGWCAALRAEVEEVAALEALAEAQQARIEALRGQLAASPAPQDDQARASTLREQVRALLSDESFREALLPSMLQAGYDRGFFIRSTDDLFFMSIGGRIQFRWTHDGTRARNHYRAPRLERDDRTGFDIARIRPRISGHVYSKDLTYLFELRADASDAYDIRTRYAWLNYRFAEPFQIRAGIFKLAATRAQIMSSGAFQFVDRPATDAVFSLGTGLGVRFWGQAFDRRLDWFVDVVNGLNDYRTRTITDDPAELDGHPAIVSRVIWHALGDQPGDLLKSRSDITWHESPALDLGMHYAFNEDAGDQRTLRIPFRRRSLLPGAYGLTTSNGLQVHQLGVDAAWQWRGLSATFEYMWRFLDVRRAGRTPYTPYWLLTGDDSTSDYHGGYLQVGYFLPIPGLERKLEVAARVGGVSSIGPGSEGSWEYAGGVNYFIREHSVKLQADVTKVYEWPISSSSNSIANVNDDALVFRVQLQVQF